MASDPTGRSAIAPLPGSGDRPRRAFPKKEAWQVAILTALCVAAAILVPPIAQPLEYHEFADSRSFFGVPNFMDVTSNVFFVLAGLAGLAVTLRSRDGAFEFPFERIPYLVFFTGITLTGFGSGYYHLAPDNDTLVWDRLPMTIAFTSLVAAQIGDRIGPRVGLATLGPALLVGIWTVVYWTRTERAGEGNLVPYLVLQGYAMIVLLAMAVLHKSRYTRGRDIVWVFAWYLLAKVFETYDGVIFDALGRLVSGHTLKHVAGAVSAALVMRMIALRSPREHGAAAGH